MNSTIDQYSVWRLKRMRESLKCILDYVARSAASDSIPASYPSYYETILVIGQLDHILAACITRY